MKQWLPRSINFSPINARYFQLTISRLCHYSEANQGRKLQELISITGSSVILHNVLSSELC